MKHITFLNKLFTAIKSYVGVEASVIITPSGITIEGHTPVRIMAFFHTGVRGFYKLPFSYFRDLPDSDIREESGVLRVAGVILKATLIEQGSILQPDNRGFTEVDIEVLRQDLKIAKALAKHTKYLLQRNLLITGSTAYYSSPTVYAQMPSPFSEGALILPPYVLELLNTLLNADLLEYGSNDEIAMFHAKKSDLELYLVMKKQKDIQKFLLYPALPAETIFIFDKELTTWIKTASKLKHLAPEIGIVFHMDRLAIRLFDTMMGVQEFKEGSLLRSVPSIAIRVSAPLVVSLLDLGMVNLSFADSQLKFSTSDGKIWSSVPTLPTGF